MEPKRAISLLLAAQMLTSPVAQAASLSSTRQSASETLLSQTVEASATPEATVIPTASATPEESVVPTAAASEAPEGETSSPSPEQTTETTVEPSAEPTAEPSAEPAVEPSAEPTVEPTVAPTEEPAVEPTEEPGEAPATEPEVEADLPVTPQEGDQITNLLELVEPFAEEDAAYSWGWGYVGFAYSQYKAALNRNGTNLNAAAGIEVGVEKATATANIWWRGMTDWQPDEEGKFSTKNLSIGSVHLYTASDEEESIQEKLGRIPDRQFAGWYVYGGPPSGDGVPQITEVIPQQSTDRDYLLPYPDPDGVDDEVSMSNVEATIIDTPEEENAWNDAGKKPEAWYRYGDTDLPIIAYWELSDNATLVANVTKNPVFSADGKTEETLTSGIYPVVKATDDTTSIDTTTNLLDSLTDKAGTKVTFDYEDDDDAVDGGEYYLRVSADVVAISPTLLAYEAFRAADIHEEAGVAISLRPAGKTAPEDMIEFTMATSVVNDSVPNGNDKYILYNNINYPMRSSWTIEGGATIPLELSTGTTEETWYNDVTVTVTPPSGPSDDSGNTKTTTYVFRIQRLNDPELVQNPGNTPIGMIRRDNGPNWEVTADVTGTTVDGAKTEAERIFQEGFVYTDENTGVTTTYPAYSFGSTSNVLHTPSGPENNTGRYDKSKVYTTGAWQEEPGVEVKPEDNVDLDPSAIVVYQNSAFTDPGFTVIDSQGTVWDAADLEKEGRLTRTVTLRVATQLDLEQIKDDAGTEQPFPFEEGATEGLRDTLDLRGVNVVPGIYEIEYTLKDPNTEQTYSSNVDDFLPSNKDHADTFRRTLVILPIPGDVDMDGAVTPTDAELLSRALSPVSDLDVEFIPEQTEENGEYHKVIELYRLRVCDVDNDGDADEDDVSVIRNGYAPRFETDVVCDYFYIPLPSGVTETDTPRIDLVVPENKEDGKIRAQLSLDYLGKNTDAITADPGALAGITPDSDGLRLNDVFWVGVRISDLDDLANASTAADVNDKSAICGSIGAVTLSIAYDADYLEPVAVTEAGVAAVGEEDQSAWMSTIKRYNISSDPSGLYGNYFWHTSFAVGEGSTPAGDYTEHYAKAVLPMENEGADLKELKVILRTETSTQARTLSTAEDSYLLRVPFRLKEYPFLPGQEEPKLEALDVSLGMGEFTIISELIPYTVSTQVAAVWSTYDIYGGSTRNLSDELVYAGGTARAIPLGENDTIRVELVNRADGSDGKTVYGEPFEYGLGKTGLDSAITPYLPKGLTYDNNTGTISGDPAEVGEFEFEIEGGDGTKTLYRIKVEPAPLTVYAVPQSRYYGEPNATLDYKYDPSDIKYLDEFGGDNYDPVAAFVNNGSSAELAKLAGYKAPRLSRDDGTVPGVATDVTQNTRAGDYVIRIEEAEGGSGLTNYVFVYANGAADGTFSATEESYGISPLEVKPRPLAIQQINDSAMTNVRLSASDSRNTFAGQTAVYQAGVTEQFTPVALGNMPNQTGLTGTEVYDDDEVEISFTAKLTWDNTAPPYYDLDDSESFRLVPADLSDLALVGESANNYRLVLPFLVTTVANATVLNNPVVDIKVENVPKLDYTYGEQLLLSGLRVTLIYEDDKTVSYSYIDENSFAVPGIQVTWEDSNTVEPSRGDTSHQLTNGQVLDAGTHNGKYLCISVPGAWNGDYTKPVRWFSDSTLAVAKKQLTLTATPMTVYYGEFDDATPLTFTYDPTQLTDDDRNYLLGKTGQSELFGTENELKELPGYVAPVLQGRLGINATAEEKVTHTTPVGTTYVIHIDHQRDANGAALSGTDNYSFYFMEGFSTAAWNERGYSLLTIQPRPIVVDTVTMSVAGQEANTKAFLYDDTTQLLLSKMYYTDTASGQMKAQSVTLTGIGKSTDPDAPDSFRATLPGDRYYIAGQAGAVAFDSSRLSGDAIVNGDQVVLTYQATYTADNPGAVPPDTTYFNMNGDITKHQGAKVHSLALATDENGKPLGDNSNYTLVFSSQVTANNRRPITDTTQALVRMRPMEAMDVATSPGKLAYTYGEELDLTGMSLRLTYESEGDNDIVGNAKVIERTLNYRWTLGGSSFIDQGLKVYWVSPDTDPNILSEDDLKALLGEPVESGTYPDVTRSGMKLLVCGRRAESDPLVWGLMDDTFTVSKKTLNLTVQPKNRYYGEPNSYIGEADSYFTASYLAGDLAAPDRAALGLATTDVLYMTADGSPSQVTHSGGRDVTGTAASVELSTLDSQYIGPRFVTAGHRGAPVSYYAIELDTTGSFMTNYELKMGTSATLRVFRRPIVVEKVDETPITTIYYNAPETDFATYAQQTGQKSASAPNGVYTVLPDCDTDNFPDIFYSNWADADFTSAVDAGMSKDFKITGDSIYGSDTLGFGMTAVFPEVGARVGFDDNATTALQPVTIRNLVLSQGYNNYILVYNDQVAMGTASPTDNNAVGRLDRRPIREIEITQNPNMDYTYSEPLDLSQMRVKITYDTKVGDSYETEDVFYYQNGALSINYWESDTVPSDPSDWNLGPQERQARAGDHLTIAPDHTPEKFVHDGKYIIVTARAHESMAYTARPVLVSDLDTNVPIPLKVNPLDLTYTLTAAGKVYDGSTDALGAITLTNPYTAGDSDRDLIYVTTGAAYENSAADLATYLNDTGKSKEAAYTFASSDATRGSGLTFTFFDPNVKYADDQHSTAAPVAPHQWQSYWDAMDHAPKTSASGEWDVYGEIASQPVLVSNLILAGPDAANYTLDTGVALDDNEGDPTKAVVPYATISKANQTIDSGLLPTVSVDAHTNAIKVTYQTHVDTEKETFDQYSSELHYEYGLDYYDGTNMVRWNPEGDWSDAFYFGGEKLECLPPAGYVPNGTTTSQPDTVTKGQIYAWGEDGANWYDAKDDSFGARTPLERDTVYWGSIRLAETHNYNASPAVSSQLDRAGEEQAALDAAAAMTATILGWVDQRPEKDDDTELTQTPAPATKTYLQRFKLVSTAEETGADGQRYTVDTLEAVWFTDILQYEKEEVLDAVLRNQAVSRYSGYYWDPDKSARLDFTAPGLDLSTPFDVDVREKQADGTVQETTLTVNVDRNADVYVVVGGGSSGILAREISILPGNISAALGSGPITLSIEYYPSSARKEGISWRTSNPSVVTIDADGVIRFVGVGTATITAVTSLTGKVATITVTVSDPEGQQQGVGVGSEAIAQLAGGANNHFDFYFIDSFMDVDGAYRFYPDRPMTRAELVTTLALFYIPKDWKWDGQISFPDLTGKESYAAAAEMMRDAGIVTGYPDGNFHGEKTATRAEIAAILCRMIGLPPKTNTGGGHAFLDAGKEDTWAYAYIDALAEAGVLLGTGEGYFHPERLITRAEVAAMLGRILLSGANYDRDTMIVPIDVPRNHWGYHLILRAVNAVDTRW